MSNTNRYLWMKNMNVVKRNNEGSYDVFILIGHLVDYQDLHQVISSHIRATSKMCNKHSKMITYRDTYIIYT